MSLTKEMNGSRRVARLVCALALLVCAFAYVSAQERQRPFRPSLTSEDLLNRPSLYTPPPSASVPAASATANASSTYYRDPAGNFTLTFPNRNWRVNARAGSAGRVYDQQSFRRIEDEGFSSATANVFVLTERANLPLVDPARLGPEAQREFAAALAARFLSSNSTVVAIEPTPTKAHAGLRIIADQMIARRVAVRASINVFERQGRLYVVVCSAPLETFDASVREFDVITNSLASSVARS